MENAIEDTQETVNTNKEFLGEQIEHFYTCIPKTVEEAEDICETESNPCSDVWNSTGNILDRIIKDPEGRRPPCLAKWPAYGSLSDIHYEQNTHQFRAAQEQTILRQMCSLRVTSEPYVFRQAAIVGTIGPASSDIPSIIELMKSGMNIARISVAHGDLSYFTEYFQNIVAANNQFKAIKDYEVSIGIMMDLRGTEIRTGNVDVKNKKGVKLNNVFLKQGSIIRLTSDKIFADRCTDKIIYIDSPNLPAHAKLKMNIFIGDSDIKLIVDSIESSNIVCLVEKGGVLKSKQKVRIPTLIIESPVVSHFDLECLKLAIQMDVDIVVVPKTRNSEMLKQIRRVLDSMCKGNNILLMAKISNYEGLEDIDCILRVADGIIIHKNDLSMEIKPEKMFIVEKEIIGKCKLVGKPVLCVAQLSGSTISKHLTRMEMNDVISSILDGADGIVVSETACNDDGANIIGKLSKTIREAEAATMSFPFYQDLVEEQTPSMEPNKAIALAAVQVANKINASAILTVTTSGKTAQMLSWFRPRCPVIAITRVGKTSRQLHLWRAVIPLHFAGPALPDWFQDVKDRFEYGISYGKDHGIIDSGDLLILVSGYRKKAGFTNCIRIVFAGLERAFFDNVINFYNKY